MNIFWNAENQTQSSWMRSAKAASVVCSPWHNIINTCLKELLVQAHGCIVPICQLNFRRRSQLVRADPVFQELPDVAAAVQERAPRDFGLQVSAADVPRRVLRPDADGRGAALSCAWSISWTHWWASFFYMFRLYFRNFFKQIFHKTIDMDEEGKVLIRWEILTTRIGSLFFGSERHFLGHRENLDNINH